MSQDCIFCKIVDGDIPADLLYEDEDVIAFNDINPQAPMHVLVIPRKHISAPADVTEADEGLVGKLIRVGSQLAADRGMGDGFRLLFNNGKKAGQTVFHVHLHVLGGRSMSWPPG